MAPVSGSYFLCEGLCTLLRELGLRSNTYESLRRLASHEDVLEDVPGLALI